MTISNQAHLTDLCSIPESVLEGLSRIVGPKGLIDEADSMVGYCKSWSGEWVGRVPLVVCPASQGEVSEIVQLCAEAAVPLVPQGGNTGLTGASQPHNDNSEILLSLSRMNRIRTIDTENNTITVEAGCVLQTVQKAAMDADRLFPVSLPSEGSCQIGGMLSTNAGGTQVIRYGNTRERVLGLEVVLADGQIWEGLRGLRKDNTGYDLKQIFIGAEGTLGIITAACLSLAPRPTDYATAIVAIDDPQAALKLLGFLRGGCGEMLQGFELMQRRAVEFAIQHIPDVSEPMSISYEWYVLIEIAGQTKVGILNQRLEEELARAYEEGLFADAVLAQSEQQRLDFWRLRENLPGAKAFEGVAIKHDVSVPISCVPDFIAEATETVMVAWPECRPVSFGHLGDGNIHFDVVQPIGLDAKTARSWKFVINRLVHDLVVHQYQGSISAEHGVGRLRRLEMARYKTPLELDLMRQVKKTFDPGNIFNPGKLLPPADW